MLFFLIAESIPKRKAIKTAIAIANIDIEKVTGMLLPIKVVTDSP
jgi:hypothetical protein